MHSLKMITCRRANKNDVALFKQVRLKALKESPDAYGSSYDAALIRDHSSWEEQLCSTTSGGHRNTQFAFFGEVCIGIAALYREPLALTGDMIMMWVDPAHRGSCAASMLVVNLIRWARESGFDSIGLSVTETNVRAIRFYENQGFCATGEIVELDAKRGLRGIRMKQDLG